MLDDLVAGQLAWLAPDASDDRLATVLAAAARRLGAGGVPVHLLAADAASAVALHALLCRHGGAPALCTAAAPPRERRAAWSAPVAIAEIGLWARDALRDAVQLGDRPRWVQLQLEQGLATLPHEARLARAAMPRGAVPVVLDPTVALLDGGQHPVALQAPGPGGDVVVQRGLPALLARGSALTALTRGLGRAEAIELAQRFGLQLRAGAVNRWAAAAWPADSRWHLHATPEDALHGLNGWAVDAASGRVDAWILAASEESARSLQTAWIQVVGAWPRGLVVLAWHAAWSATFDGTRPLRVMAAEWPPAPLVALDALRRWSAAGERGPRFDGGHLLVNEGLLAAAIQAGAVPPAAPGEWLAGRADQLLRWQLTERARARQRSAQHEASLRQLLSFAGDAPA